MSWHTDTHWWRLSSWTWNHLTSPWTKQATWLGIAHSGDWCLHLALCTCSVAGQKWMNEWMTDRECWAWPFVTSDATCCVNRWLWLQQVGRSIGNFCASTLWRYSISVMFVVHVCIRNIIHTISLHVFGWLARDSMLSALYAIARPSVRLSVCPSHFTCIWLIFTKLLALLHFGTEMNVGSKRNWVKRSECEVAVE